MKFHIASDIPGRIRLRAHHYAFSDERALALECMIHKWSFVSHVKVNPVSGSILIEYDENQKEKLLSQFKEIDVSSFDLTPYKDYIATNQYAIIQEKQYYLYS